mgnify:CR=1 FL=1
MQKCGLSWSWHLIKNASMSCLQMGTALVDIIFWHLVLGGCCKHVCHNFWLSKILPSRPGLLFGNFVSMTLVYMTLSNFYPTSFGEFVSLKFLLWGHSVILIPWNPFFNSCLLNSGRGTEITILVDFWLVATWGNITYFCITF